MDLQDLIYGIAHDYPGGVTSLAPRISDTRNYPQVLINKLNPHTSTHNVNVREFERIADLCNANFKVSEYFAAKANAVVIPLLQCHGSDMELLDGFMEVIAELGKFSVEFQYDWADGRITQDEFMRLSSDARAIQARVVSLMSRIEQIVEWPKQHDHHRKQG
jgi:hypothetical protein